MDTGDLILFRKIADAGSISRAGRENYDDPSVLLRRLDAMEKELGERLFVRTNRGVALTDAGRALYRASDRFLSAYDRTVLQVRKAGDGNRKRIRTAITPMIQKRELSRMWEILADLFPDRDLVLCPYGQTEGERARMLEEMGCRYDILACCGGREASSAGCRFAPLFREPLVFGIPEGSLLSRMEFVLPRDLDGGAVLMPDPGSFTFLAGYAGWMKKNIPGIRICAGTETGDELLNRAVQERIPVLIPASWGGIRPDLASLPAKGFGPGEMQVSFGYSCPAGSVYDRQLPEPNSGLPHFLPDTVCGLNFFSENAISECRTQK